MKVKLNLNPSKSKIKSDIDSLMSKQIKNTPFLEENSIKNPKKAFDLFESHITKTLKNNRKVNQETFYLQLNAICNEFKNKSQIDLMNKNIKRFAETLVSLGNGTLASIIYSLLIKLNLDNPKLLEGLALNGLAIAKRFNDPIHIMARCEDLRRLYVTNGVQDEKFVKVLYEEKRALNSICTNYERAQGRYKSIRREMKPLKNYQIMLGAIKIQIAKAIKDKSPKDAMQELKSAYELLKIDGDKKFINEIPPLLDELAPKV